MKTLKFYADDVNFYTIHASGEVTKTEFIYEILSDEYEKNDEAQDMYCVQIDRNEMKATLYGLNYYGCYLFEITNWDHDINSPLEEILTPRQIEDITSIWEEITELEDELDNAEEIEHKKEELSATGMDYEDLMMYF